MACADCRRSKLKCDEARPCKTCSKKSRKCIDMYTVDNYGQQLHQSVPDRSEQETQSYSSRLVEIFQAASPHTGSLPPISLLPSLDHVRMSSRDDFVLPPLRGELGSPTMSGSAGGHFSSKWQRRPHNMDAVEDK